MLLDDKLRKEYQNLYDTLIIQPGWQDDADSDAQTAFRNKSRYEHLAAHFPGLPWFVVAIIHKKECSFKFSEHLHNGDSLSARTVRVPAGRPIKGNPPFTFEESALDALDHDRVRSVAVWDIPGTLYFFEKYNGWGYRPGHKGFHTTPEGRSPYLWCGSQHWQKGKFVKDGIFDPNAGSKNLGAAVLLKALENKKLIDILAPHNETTLAS